MDITLEKIELVKDRTGVSYAEAKEALEEADGSVVDAIIGIEETIDQKGGKSFGRQGTAVFDSLKELVKKGNVSKILVKREDDVILNLPVNAGILGAVIAPWGAVAGVVAAFGFKCTIEVVKDDGTIIDVSDSVSDTMGSVIEKGSVVMDAAKEKGADIYQDAKEKGADIYQSAKSKASQAINKAKEKKEDIDFSSCFTGDDDQEEQDEAGASYDTEEAPKGEPDVAKAVKNVAKEAKSVAKEVKKEAKEVKKEAAKKVEKAAKNAKNAAKEAKEATKETAKKAVEKITEE